jgi:hypothetical protein
MNQFTKVRIKNVIDNQTYESFGTVLSWHPSYKTGPGKDVIDIGIVRVNSGRSEKIVDVEIGVFDPGNEAFQSGFGHIGYVAGKSVGTDRLRRRPVTQLPSLWKELDQHGLSFMGLNFTESCTGDSGGPYYHRARAPLIQFGVNSFGFGPKPLSQAEIDKVDALIKERQTICQKNETSQECLAYSEKILSQSEQRNINEVLRNREEKHHKTQKCSRYQNTADLWATKEWIEEELKKDKNSGNARAVVDEKSEYGKSLPIVEDDSRNPNSAPRNEPAKPIVD